MSDGKPESTEALVLTLLYRSIWYGPVCIFIGASILNASLQVIAPSFVNVLNVYAFCNLVSPGSFPNNSTK